jgi:hypothetical protein
MSEQKEQIEIDTEKEYSLKLKGDQLVMILQFLQVIPHVLKISEPSQHLLNSIQKQVSEG